MLDAERRGRREDTAIDKQVDLINVRAPTEKRKKKILKTLLEV